MSWFRLFGNPVITPQNMLNSFATGGWSVVDSHKAKIVDEKNGLSEIYIRDIENNTLKLRTTDKRMVAFLSHPTRKTQADAWDWFKGVINTISKQRYKHGVIKHEDFQEKTGFQATTLVEPVLPSVKENPELATSVEMMTPASLKKGGSKDRVTQVVDFLHLTDDELNESIKNPEAYTNLSPEKKGDLFNRLNKMEDKTAVAAFKKEVRERMTKQQLAVLLPRLTDWNDFQLVLTELQKKAPSNWKNLVYWQDMLENAPMLEKFRQNGASLNAEVYERLKAFNLLE